MFPRNEDKTQAWPPSLYVLLILITTAHREGWNMLLLRSLISVYVSDKAIGVWLHPQPASSQLHNEMKTQGKPRFLEIQSPIQGD